MIVPLFIIDLEHANALIAIDSLETVAGLEIYDAKLAGEPLVKKFRFFSKCLRDVYNIVLDIANYMRKGR